MVDMETDGPKVRLFTCNNMAVFAWRGSAWLPEIFTGWTREIDANSIVTRCEYHVSQISVILNAYPEIHL